MKKRVKKQGGAKFYPLSYEEEENEKRESESDANKKKGYEGEKCVKYELAYLPVNVMIFHNLHLYSAENRIKAQIDFLLITEKNLYILECKNWSSSIEVDRYNNFHTNTKTKGIVRVGSPIGQLKRHKLMVEKTIFGLESGCYKKMVSKRIIRKNLKNIVVLADNKASLYIEPEDNPIRKQVVYLDHLLDYILETEKKTRNGILSHSIKKILSSWIDAFGRASNEAYKKIGNDEQDETEMEGSV